MYKTATLGFLALLTTLYAAFFPSIFGAIALVAALPLWILFFAALVHDLRP